MNNLKRQFVTYEQAKKLSELGFNEPCFGYYIQLKNPDEGVLKIETIDNIDDKSYVYAPTYSQIFMWFRDKHNLRSFIDTRVRNVDSPFQWIYDYQIKMGNGIDTKPFYGDDSETYEEAESACLNKLIELLNEANIKLLGT